MWECILYYPSMFCYTEFLFFLISNTFSSCSSTSISAGITQEISFEKTLQQAGAEHCFVWFKSYFCDISLIGLVFKLYSSIPLILLSVHCDNGLKGSVWYDVASHLEKFYPDMEKVASMQALLPDNFSPNCGHFCRNNKFLAVITHQLLQIGNTFQN